MLAAATALALCGPALSQSESATNIEAVQTAAQATARAERLYRDGRYLAAIETVGPFALDAVGQIRDQMAFQYWRQLSAAIGDQPPASSANDEPPLGPNDRALLQRAELEDAISVITEQAKSTRIVILNEDHAVSRHRAFGLAVAQALRPLGYEVLALEALANDANPVVTANRTEALRIRGVPRRDGFYLRDPEFGDFVRQALSLGYRTLPYEAIRYDTKLSRVESIALREREQAANLARAVRLNPSSKFLIYVGHSHVAENPMLDRGGTWTRWMAARLKQTTGVDPLTIDQTTLGFDGGWKAAHELLAPRLSSGSMILTLSGRPFAVGQYASAVDLQVVHRKPRLVEGRPDWLLEMGRHALAIPRELLPAAGKRLIQAFVEREGVDGVPVDQVVVEAGREPVALMVPNRAVRIAWQDAGPVPSN